MALRATAPSFSAGGGASDAASASTSSGAADTDWLALPKPTARLPGALLAYLPQDNDDAGEAAAEARRARARTAQGLGHRGALLTLPVAR
jgi:hypothetical protein